VQRAEIHNPRRRDAGRTRGSGRYRCWPWVKSPRKLTLSQAEARGGVHRQVRQVSPARPARSASVSCSRAAREDLRYLQTSRAASARRPRPSNLAYLSAADGCRDAALGSGPRRARPAFLFRIKPAGQGRRQGAHPRHQDPRRRDQGHRTSTTWTCSPPTSPTANMDPAPRRAPIRRPTRKLAQLLRAAGRRVRQRIPGLARRASRWSRRTSSTPPTCCWCR